MFSSLEEANISTRYYSQYSEQGHKILSSTDEHFFTIFFNKVRIKFQFQEFFVGKRDGSPYTLLQISICNFIPYNIYFLYKTYLFWILPPWNDVTVSNVLNKFLTAVSNHSETNILHKMRTVDITRFSKTMLVIEDLYYGRRGAMRSELAVQRTLLRSNMGLHNSISHLVLILDT